MQTTTQNKVTDIVAFARKIAHRSNEPMTLNEIKGKFQLEFPFTVKKVVDAGMRYQVSYPVGTVLTVLDYSTKERGHYDLDSGSYTPGDLAQWVLI